jgi:hypothetical protein
VLPRRRCRATRLPEKTSRRRRGGGTHAAATGPPAMPKKAVDVWRRWCRVAGNTSGLWRPRCHGAAAAGGVGGWGMGGGIRV